MKRVAAQSGVPMRGIRSADVDFTLSPRTRETIVSGETQEQTTDQDKIINTVTSAVVYDEFDIRPEVVRPVGDASFEFTALDPGVATVNSDGQTTRVADGTASFLVSFAGVKKRVSGLDYSETGGNTASEFVSWKSGTLMKECNDAVDNRIDGLTPADAIDIFDTQNHSAEIYVRNIGVWCADVDLTCISPWNSRGDNRWAGTLVAKDCVVLAEHYPVAVGDTVRFIGNDNTIYTRTVAGVQYVGPSNSNDSYATDIQVAVLSEELPAAITPCKVFPVDVLDYLPHIAEGVPCLCLDQEEKALITDLFTLTDSRASFTAPDENGRSDYYETKISGDSGNPAFAIVSGELVLITTWTFGGSGSGPNYAANIDAIETAMTAAGSNYGLTVLDLSTYENFGV